MIYPKDVHKYDLVSTIQRNYNESMDFFESVAGDMYVARTHATNLKQFGIFTEDAKESLIGSAKEAIRRLGEKILEIIERIKLFVADRIQEWKTAMWKRKSKEQKLREIERKYPKEIGELTIALDRGQLDFACFKDLNDFYSQIDAVLDNIKKGQIDPKSIRGRWENIKRKTLENKEFIATVIAMIGAAVGVGGLLLKYKEYRQKAQQHSIKDDVEDIETGFKNTRQKLSWAVEAVKKMERETDPDKQQEAVETLTLLGQISATIERMTAGSVGKLTMADLAIEESFFNGATSMAEKLNSVKTAAIQQGQAIYNVTSDALYTKKKKK